VSGRIIARGATLEEAFVRIVLSLFSRVVDPARIESREVREVRAHGDSPEALLAHWIAECAYVHEMEGFVFGAIDVILFDVEPGTGAEPVRLYAVLHGEELAGARHRAAGTIESVAPADISIRRDGEGYEIQLM
jgi:SHS2 domain-containing protein